MSMVHCQLWMGSLEPYMTETFIMNSFRKMGETPLSVKVMRNKFTGDAAGYCFVHFANDEEAIDAMHKLNGKPIPGTNPVRRFRLNNASNTCRSLLDREFSVWVGDLSPDVDDYNLYRVFASKYNTIKAAKVILDNSGFSKGYGFVRFGSEDEQKDSLTVMNGFVGLGSKALKICNAVPKPKEGGEMTLNPGSKSASSSSSAPYANYNQQYYDYWQNYATWQGYYDQQQQQQHQQQHPQQHQQQHQHQQHQHQHQHQHQQAAAAGDHADSAGYRQGAAATAGESSQLDGDLELIEHSRPVDVDALNREAADQDSLLWDALESSKWLPCEALIEMSPA